MESLARYPASPYAAGPGEARMNVPEILHVENFHKRGSLKRSDDTVVASEQCRSMGVIAAAPRAVAEELLPDPSNPATHRSVTAAAGLAALGSVSTEHSQFRSKTLKS